MLQPDKRKLLDSNIRELLANGGTPDDIEKMASDFTSKFSDEAIKKKEPSPSTVTAPKSVSSGVDGSSAATPSKMKTFTGFSPEDLTQMKSSGTPVPKINKPLKQALDTNKANLKRQADLEKELKTVKVTPENQEEVSKKTDELNALQKQQQGFKEAAQVRTDEKQRYSKVSALTNHLATGSSQLGVDIAAIPELVYDAFAIPQNAVADIFDLPSLRTDSEKFKKTIGVSNAVKDYYQGQVKQLRQEAEQTDLKYKDGIYDSFVQGDYSGGFDQLTNSFTESLPATTSIMVGGAAMKAPQLIAASSMLFGAEKNEQLKKENPEMNANVRVSNALATGLIQGATESLGTGSIGAAAKGLVEREGPAKAVTILKDGLVKYYEAALKKNPLLASMSGEGLEEAFQGIAENSVDVATGKKPADYNVFENAADDFIGGVFGGAIFGAGLKGIEQVANYDDKQAIKANTKMVFDLQKNLQNPELSPESRSEINKNIDVLVKANQKMVQKNIDHVESLSPKVREELIKAIDLTGSIKAKAEQIKTDPNTSDTTKKILLDNLSKEYKAANERKTAILGGSFTEVDALPFKERERLKREALNQLKEELNPDGKKDMTISDEQVTKRANKIYEETKPKTEVKETAPIAKDEPIELPNVNPDATRTDAGNIEESAVNLPEATPEAQETGSEPTVNLPQEIQTDEAQTENDPLADGNIQPGTDTVGKGRIVEQQITSDEDLQNATDTPKSEGDTSEAEVKAGKRTFFVDKENGNYSVINAEDGKPVDEKTRVKVLEQHHAENNTYAEGKKAFDGAKEDLTFNSPKEVEEFVLKNSENPAEIAEAISRNEQSPISIEESKDFKEQKIYDALKRNKLDKSAFQFGDKNNFAPQKGFSYFAKENGRKIDDLADEINVHPEEILDFIKKHPRISDFKGGKLVNNVQYDLEQKFEKLTGLKPTKKVIAQAMQQANALSENYSTLDTMSAKELENLYNESVQSEKEYYGSREKTEPGSSRTGETNEDSNNNQRSEKQSKNTGEDNASEEKVTSKKEQRILDDALNIPDSDEIKNFLSGETIQETDQFENLDTDQKYSVMKLAEVGMHGKSIIEKAKGYFGENYIDKVLGIIDKASSAATKTLLTLSLDNDLRDRRAGLIEELNNTTDKAKKQSLKEQILDTTQEINKVQIVRQNLARNTSMALNINRLGRIMRDGSYDPSVTNKVFTEGEVETKEAIKRSVETTVDDIQKEYEKSNSDIDDIIADKSAPKKKRSRDVIKKDLTNAFADLRKDLLDVAKGKGGAKTSIPYADQIIAATPHIIKISKLLSELGTLKASEIVDKIHTAINQALPGITKDDISDIIEKNNLQTEEESYQNRLAKEIAKTEKAIKEHGTKKPVLAGKNSVWSQRLSDLKNQLSDLRKETSNERKKIREALNKTKDLLVKAGFGKEITVTKSSLDENGNKVKVSEKRNVLDWKKLLGENGSIKSMKENIGKVLKEEGYSQKEIDTAIDEMNDSLNQIKTDITEKALTDLQNRNKIPKTVDVKSESKKLAETYNQGLFENSDDKYDLVLNRILGFNDFQQSEYEKLKGLSQSLATLFNNRTIMNDNKMMSEEAFKTQASIINKQINEVIKTAFRGKKLSLQNIMSTIKDYSDMATLSKLLSLKQNIENPFSGKTEQTYQNIGSFFNKDKPLSKELINKIRKNSRYVFQDIAYNGSPDYGDSSFSDIQSKKLDDLLRKIKTKKGSQLDKFKNTAAAIISGSAYLNAADGYYKSLMTETNFAKTLIDILSNKKYGLDVNMTQEEATKYVSEKLTGENYDKAVKQAGEIIDKVNKEAGEDILPKTTPNIHRFAMDIVKDNISGDGFLDEDTVKKAFNASWKAAGSALGHETNNPVSQLYKYVTAGLDKEMKKAIKEKDHKKFAALTAINIAKNITMPFVSGRFNWATLAAQKSGANLGLSMLVTANRKGKYKIDFKSEEGIRNLEEALHWKIRHDLTVKRSLVGLAINVASIAALAASGGEDKLNELLDKSPTFKKLFTIFISPLVSTYLAAQSGGFDKAIDQIMNIYSVTGNEDRRSVVGEFKKFVDDTKSSETRDKAEGYLGKSVGSAFDTPLPWRLYTDYNNVFKEIQDQKQYKTNYNATSFSSGLLQGGMLEALGLREVLSGHSEKEGSEPKKKKSTSKSRSRSGGRTTLSRSR